MANEWVSGFFGLGGAVLGAAVALIQQRRDARLERDRRHAEQLALDRSREEARQREVDAAREAARVAARILQADSLQSRLRVNSALRKGRYWSEPFALPHQSWTTYREQVARYLDLDAWSKISLWFRSVASVEAQATAARDFSGGNVRRPELTERGRKQLQLALKRADLAITALEQFTGDDTQLSNDGDEDLAEPTDD